MGQTHQTPFTTDFLQAAPQEAAEAPRFFALATHRFHDHLRLASRARPGGVRTVAAMRSLAVVGRSLTSASRAW